MHLEDHGWRICPAVDERIKIVVAYNNLLFIICFDSLRSGCLPATGTKRA